MNENNKTGKNGASKKILYGIIIAIIAGFLFGGFLPEVAISVSIIGEIFLNLLMMIVVPLVMLSMIVGITNLGDIRKIGTIGKRTVVYYFITTALSVLIGIILVNIIEPGVGISTSEQYPDMSYSILEKNQKVVIIPDEQLKKKQYGGKYIIRLSDQKIEGNIVSNTMSTITVSEWNRKINRNSGKGIELDISLQGMMKGKEKKGVSDTLHEVLLGNRDQGREGMIPRNVFNAMQKMNILPLIFFSLLFGAALSLLGPKGDKAIEVFSACNDAVMTIVGWIMYLAPPGIFGIIASRIGHAGGFYEFLPELQAVGKYSLTVIAGLSFHGLIILPLILYFIGKRNPFTFLKGVSSALLNAFSTASSSATLPLTMETIQEENGISQRTSGFVLPIGATINMDGTALYEAVAAIFIAQVYGVDLGFMQQTIIFLTATLAAIGAAGIPEAGLVTMVIVLNAVGLPVEGVGIILTIDWLLDRFRTTVNVWGDSVGSGVIETLEDQDAI